MKFSITMYTVNIICVITFVLTVPNKADISSNIDTNQCVLPNYPKNGRWSIGSDAKHTPGEKVKSGVVISVTCDSPYRLNGSSVLECNSGKWSAEIGECLELCPPIFEKQSTVVTCTNSNGQKINCTKPTNGTIATFKCSPFYENEELNRNPFRRCENGRWNKEILYCSAVCGLDPTSSTNGTLKSFYPWNVLIYQKLDKEKELLGFGTLITEKAVLTSATALMDYSNFPFGNLYLPENMVLAAGKSVEDFNDPGHVAQYSLVHEMFVPDNYRGYMGNFVSDVAILIATSPFKMTSGVQIVCVDWSSEYKKEFSQVEMAKSVAKVGAPVKSLKHNFTQAYEIVVPLPYEFECFYLMSQRSRVLGKVSLWSYHFLYSAIDKYCGQTISLVKFSNCTKSINPGVGLVTKKLLNGKYYIVGVASLGSVENDCTHTTKQFNLFTRVADYINFISEKANFRSTIEQNQFQTSCGIKSIHAQTLIVNGSTVAKGDYPWQVAVYDVSDSKKKLICGGSLINRRVILTAAHCVTDDTGKKLPKEKYVIAVGKYYRNFDDPRDNNSQFSALKEIIVPTEYKSILQNYLADIAILISETSFEITKETQPVCVDWEAKYEAKFLKPNVTGFVAGWGFTEENQNPSKVVKDLEVLYIDPEQCKNELPSEHEIFLTNDKLCSGFLNKGKSACQGDSGSGLVFKNKIDDRYYLAGIVSVSPQSPTGGCNSQQYSLYTRISSYINNFVRNKVSLYWS